MCQVFRAVKASSPGPIFVFLWKADSLAVGKSIDNGDCSVIVAAGIVPDVDYYAVQVVKVAGNSIQGVRQAPRFNAFQLENPDVTKCPRPAIVKHPGLKSL